jgi:hypothetical protein
VKIFFFFFFLKKPQISFHLCRFLYKLTSVCIVQHDMLTITRPKNHQNHTCFSHKYCILSSRLFFSNFHVFLSILCFSCNIEFILTLVKIILINMITFWFKKNLILLINSFLVSEFLGLLFDCLIICISVWKRKFLFPKKKKYFPVFKNK